MFDELEENVDEVVGVGDEKVNESEEVVEKEAPAEVEE